MVAALGWALKVGVGGSVLLVGCLWSGGISWSYVGTSWGVGRSGFVLSGLRLVLSSG